MAFTEAFERKAHILWSKFQNEFPDVDKRFLVDAFDDYFIRKKREGYLGAMFFLDFSKKLRKGMI